MVAEQRLDDRSLHADAAAMDQPHLTEAACLRRAEVFVDDRGHVTRQERVEIEAVLDRELDRIVWVQSTTATGSTGGSERWGVWGAISGPPTSRSAGRP